MRGSVASKKGYPRMISSSPMSATRKLWQVIESWCWTMISAVWVTVPCRLVVPSTFRTFRGLGSSFNGRWCRSIKEGEMKHSVAPQSNIAVSSARCSLVYSETETLIDLF